jgi:hypothetical protein
MPIEKRGEKRAIKMADFEILRGTASGGRDAFWSVSHFGSAR